MKKNVCIVLVYLFAFVQVSFGQYEPVRIVDPAEDKFIGIGANVYINAKILQGLLAPHKEARSAAQNENYCSQITPMLLNGVTSDAVLPRVSKALDVPLIGYKELNRACMTSVTVMHNMDISDLQALFYFQGTLYHPGKNMDFESVLYPVGWMVEQYLKEEVKPEINPYWVLMRLVDLAGTTGAMNLSAKQFYSALIYGDANRAYLTLRDYARKDQKNRALIYSHLSSNYREYAKYVKNLF